MKRKVLIVEDEENIANAEKIILKDDFKVHVARDGMEGLMMAKELEPDLVLLDLMLPRMDGLDLCNKLRKNSKLKNVKIVMVTAKNDAFDEQKGMEAGANDYITKPFEPEELLKVIKQQLL